MENIVISLTVIDSRISNLSKVINSILNKKTLPNIIHIFYSDTKNIVDNGISESDSELKNIIQPINNNVEIKISKTDNIGPYRKIIPALKIYTNHIIITIDDDEIFESNIIGDFLDAYNKFKCIICSVGRIIDFNDWTNMKDTIDYYKKIYNTDKPCMNILPEGYGGILYHSNMFDKKFIDYDYNNLSKTIIQNDDIFIRYYTFNLAIPVHIIYVYQSNMYNCDIISTLYKSNIRLKLCDIFDDIDKSQADFIKTPKIDYKDDIRDLINLYMKQKNDIYKRVVHTGTDVKKLQYKINHNPDIKVIDLNDIIQKRYFPDSQSNINTILVNIEKDKHRYDSAIKEYKNIQIKDFVHLKATYWREKETFEKDMSSILYFFKDFNPRIVNSDVKLDIFSVFNDKNIMIQDGPLACYCSHVRGIIYGYQNFTNYTIITEDDLHINDMDLIIENITKIPDDWDIICLGAQPINKYYDGEFYKFNDLFHSTQFYIIRNSCMDIIFKNIYPICDQIDILLSKLHDQLNIYNIPNSVLQKNFESNTQNNLFVIYNSPNYEFIRITINKVKALLFEIICSELKIDCKTEQHEKFLKNIVLKILFDVIFSKILSVDEIDANYFNELKDNISNFNIYDEYFLNNQREKLHTEIYVIINACVKGINADITTKNIIDDIYEIIKKFNLSNNGELFPMNYGSTSNVYLLKNNIVVKVYNNFLRWQCQGHCEKTEIFEREIYILDKLKSSNYFQKIYSYNDNMIYMEYLGDSLFDNFMLPHDWENQIRNIFQILDDNRIFYPEFNLKNILILNNRLYLIDYGLARICDESNENNLLNFIEIINILREKFNEIKDVEQQHIFYNNFINNIKLDKDSKYLANIF